jgi:hypothetical protein
VIRKGFTIDTQQLVIDRLNINYDDTVFDGLYVKDVDKPSKEGANILFAAFTFPMEAHDEIAAALRELRAAKKVFEDLQAEIYYKRFGAIKRKY